MEQTGYRLAYACQQCGFLAEAQVTVARRSRRNAKLSLALSRCPTCNWRDARVHRKFLIGSALKVALGAALPLVVAVLAGRAGMPSLALSAVAAAAAAGWFIYTLRVQPFATVAERVRFLSSGEVAIRRRVSSRKLVKPGRTTSSRLRAIADAAQGEVKSS